MSINGHQKRGLESFFKTGWLKVGEMLEELGDKFAIFGNPNEIKLNHRLDINNVIGSSGGKLEQESRGEVIDLYTPQTWEEMKKFNKKKVEEIRRAKFGYQNWLRKNWE